MASRPPLWVRLRDARHAARKRVRARATTRLTAKQLADDPFGRGIKAPMDKLVDVSVVLAGAMIVHGAIFGVSRWIGGSGDARRDTGPVVVEMREQPEKQQPETVEPPEPPKIDIPEPKDIEPPKPKVVETVEPEPVEPDAPEPKAKKPPPKVVGLSLGNTVEGGGGAAFAVGETRSGSTRTTAEDPKNKQPEAKAPAKKGDPEEPSAGGKGNKAATRIPTAGAGKYVLPKRTRRVTPIYPEVLKSQGIEANVTVIVSLDETGKVTAVKIARGSPHQAFNDAAEKAAWKETFSPATRGGKPIPYTLSFTYRFRLDDQ